MAPPLPNLSPQAQVALLARTLYREGYDDHLAGHITVRQPDDSLLVNPFALTWDELRASDIMRIDLDGNVLEGPWTVTPAITLHLELHKARHDIAVAVHNHPRWGTLWADAGRVPPVYDQTGAMVAGEVAVYDEYDGPVNDRANAAKAVAALGDTRMALLANHGVLVVAGDIPKAHHRCVVLEWRCRQAWHLEAMGGGRPMAADVAEPFGALFDNLAFPGMWEAMVRRELRADPSVLE
jgi:ribulose-5-phosphate 4-epimerase/fuculose-1-phosphate aldolase